MSATSFKEADHPRGVAGRFRKKPGSVPSDGINRDGFESPYVADFTIELTETQRERMVAALSQPESEYHGDPISAQENLRARQYWDEVRRGVRDPNTVDNPWTTPTADTADTADDPWAGLMDSPDMFGLPPSDRHM